jgi:methionyl-tRNA formyltransferase
LPRFGTFNLHASLLPQYRGAAPINWAIINGEKETGVTTFLLNHQIDTGDIIGQVRCPILPEDNIGTLYDKLMNIGSGLVLETVEKIAAGNIDPIVQSHIPDSELKPAPKIFKEDCLIDWTKEGEQIVNFVRGLSPYPAAWSRMYKEGQEVGSAKIFNVRFEQANHERTAGEVRTDGRTTLEVACKEGWIALEELQLAGKRRMAVRDLLLGLRDAADYCFTSK